VPLFSFFPNVKPINKACCNTVKVDIYINMLEVVGHVDTSRIGCRVVLMEARGCDDDYFLGVDQG
jgi:hypothetical protein